MKKILPWNGIALIAMLLLLVILVNNEFQRTHQSMKQQLEAGSQLIGTPYGKVEYHLQGTGFPVMMLHGTGGGYDQCGLMFNAWVDSAYVGLSLSRFGYTRSTMPENPSPTLQAHACAALLDSLNIERVVVIGVSAGGRSALEFARNYPTRCAGLIMVSAISKQHLPLTPVQKRIYENLFHSDFVYWLATLFFSEFLYRSFGTPQVVIDKLTARQKDSLTYFIKNINPVSMRKKGILSDIEMHEQPYTIRDITLPTLVIHAQDDPLVPFSHAENTASRIPGARLLALTEGGHLMIGQFGKIKSEVTDFLHGCYSATSR